MIELRAQTKLACLTPVMALALSLGGCAQDVDAGGEAMPSPQLQVVTSKDQPVGTTTITIDGRDGRKLPVQLWYPATEEARAQASAGRPSYELEPAGPRREKLKGLLTSGTAGCTNLTMHAAIDATPAAGAERFPLVVVSHHYAGTRISTHSVNEQLARSGFVVAAPDHVGGTLFEYEPSRPNDLSSSLTGEFLKVRAADMSRVLDVLLSETASVVPEGIRGRIDPARVGIYGHSFGAITAGMVVANEPRVKSAAYVAMVVTSAVSQLLVGTPPITRFRVPALYLLAQEDKSAVALGGAPQIRLNFENQTPPAFLVEVRDLGHFAFADDLAAIPAFADGCGKGTRIDRPLTQFTNLDAALAREIAARYITAFFAHQFQGGPAAALSEAVPADTVVTRARK